MPNPDGTLTPQEQAQAAAAMRAGMPNALQRQAAVVGTGDQIGSPGFHQPIVGTRGAVAMGDKATNEAYAKTYDQQIAAGQRLDGSHSFDNNQNDQNEVFGNLSNAQYLVKQQGDFGLGSNNNEQTAAMLGNAQATGDKYSALFGKQAATAGANSAAAGARGLDAYQGDTGQYQQGLTNALDSRGLQTGAYDRLMNFASGPQGPSAARAQLNQATDANLANTLALARSGRGMGGSQAGLRQAMSQNAVTQQQSANQAAALRAQENQTFQGQRLSALSAAGGIAGQTAASDQAYGKLGLEGAQYHTDTAIKGTQLNDASSQAWAAQQQAALGQGLGADVGAQTQQLNINATALSGRESENSLANQNYATSKGLSTSAAIADANRQQAYIAGGMSAAGAVIQSDERGKTNIIPLGNQPAPLPSQSGGSVMSAPAGPSGPTNAQVDEQRQQALGSNIGKVAGAGIGTAVAGPIGGLVGSVAGGVLGKIIGSDIRSKTNIRPLDDANPYGGGAQPSGSFEQLEALASKYGAAGVADKPKAVKDYSGVSPKAYQRFARDDSHPILSQGDALLADSARNAPGSLYEYKDKRDGAGTYAGPMAQDLAAHPVTRGAVGKDPNTGKLVVDGARAATVGLAQNHAQQNQLDVLDAKIAELQSMLKRKPGDEKATSFSTSTGGL